MTIALLGIAKYSTELQVIGTYDSETEAKSTLQMLVHSGQVDFGQHRIYLQQEDFTLKELTKRWSHGTTHYVIAACRAIDDPGAGPADGVNAHLLIIRMQALDKQDAESEVCTRLEPHWEVGQVKVIQGHAVAGINDHEPALDAILDADYDIDHPWPWELLDVEEEDAAEAPGDEAG